MWRKLRLQKQNFIFLENFCILDELKWNLNFVAKIILIQIQLKFDRNQMIINDNNDNDDKMRKADEQILC